MNNSYNLTTLEELLVKEFSNCQSLHALTKEERMALSKNDVKTLSTLIEDKEILLDELGQIEDERRMIVQKLAEGLGLRSQSPTVADIVRAVNPEVASRLSHLREGITALAGNIRDMTSGNQALAASALERVDAMQAFLLDLLRPSLTYHPSGIIRRADVNSGWDADQRM
jgi:flagellar biosynthesis/type III secretory pathway chaperone